MSVIGSFHQVALAETYVDPRDGTIRVNDSLSITPSFGAIWYRTIDLGFPDVRTSMQERPEADGAFDETRFHGSRSLSLEGIVLEGAFGNLPETWSWPPDVPWNSASYWISELSSWASPSRRYRFYFTDEKGRSRFIDVRGDNFTAATDMDEYSFRQFQLGMVNPSGRIYSFATGEGATADGRWEQEIKLQANETGRPYPRDYDYAYPPGATGVQAIQYKGTVATGCLIRFHTGSSTLTGPRFTITAPNGFQQSIGFSSGLVVATNTMLLIDTQNRTVTTQADNATEATNVAQFLQAPMQWPQLRPGIDRSNTSSSGQSKGHNSVTFSAASAPAANARLTVVWADADLF